MINQKETGMVKDGKNKTRIAKRELEKFRLNFEDAQTSLTC